MEFILVTELFYCSQKIMYNGLKFLAFQTLKQRKKNPKRLLPYQKVLTFKYKQKTQLRSTVLRIWLNLHSVSKFTRAYKQEINLQKYLRRGLLTESTSGQAQHLPATVVAIAP